MQFDSSTISSPPAPPTAGVAASCERFAGAVPVQPEAPAPQLNLAETILHLLRLLPGRTLANGLSDHQLGLTLKLDAAVFAELEPVLGSVTEYHPFAADLAKVTEPPLNAHILIVEDTPVARIMLKRTLEQLPGCRITEAGSGAEALTILNGDAVPDLCISDVSMPDMDGLALLREIRATSTLAHLDVMLCTASTDRDTVLKAAELNVCRYLLKPYNPAEVKRQVRETLLQSAVRLHQKLAALQARVRLGPEATVEVLRSLGQQLPKDVAACRRALASGKLHAAALTLQGLKATCTSIKESVLISRLDALQLALSSEDLSAALEGLEMLLSEGKRVSQMADRFAFTLANRHLIPAASA